MDDEQRAELLNLLSPRELQYFRLRCFGYPISAIVDYIGEVETYPPANQTVRNTLRKAYRKLGLAGQPRGNQAAELEEFKRVFLTLPEDAIARSSGEPEAGDDLLDESGIEREAEIDSLILEEELALIAVHPREIDIPWRPPVPPEEAPRRRLPPWIFLAMIVSLAAVATGVVSRCKFYRNVYTFLASMKIKFINFEAKKVYTFS